MRHTIVRDGVVAGALGATGVAVWFLIIDTALGHPFATPEALGAALLRVLGHGEDDPAALVVLAYTVFHYVAFIAAASLAAVIVHWADRQPGILAGAFVLFVATEIGFYALTAILAQSATLGAVAWYQVAIGNTIAAVLMGTYLWKMHPALGRELDLALNGRADG